LCQFGSVALAAINGWYIMECIFYMFSAATPSGFTATLTTHFATHVSNLIAKDLDLKDF
jgi:hypothetical protein